METKTCILCKEKKDINNFYKNLKMTLGVDSKCKECAKKQSIKRFESLKNNNTWIEKEKERSRKKYHRLYSNVKNKEITESGHRKWMSAEEKKKAEQESKKRYLEKNPNSKKLSAKKYREKYPEKQKAINISQRIKPLINGNHLHHWSYNIKHAKDVIELNAKDHAKIHRFIKYDKGCFMYRDLLGNLLDTREKHEELIKKVLENF